MQLHFSNHTDSTRLDRVDNKTNSTEKQPSKLGILVLFFIVITLYGFGLSTLNKAVISITEAAIKQTVIDY